MLLTFPVMGIKLNSVDQTVEWQFDRVILLGVAGAAVSRLFCRTLHFMEHTVPKLLPNPWVRVFAGGMLVIGFSYLFGVGRYNGAGMSVITAAVEQGQALP